ncbi:MAG TPA: NUDIX domain-containing protein [Candidatus Nanopelagicales bacterium]|nr:NUDIX domain-containing protein [Candidatus Nanopelagicales bacterium]
MSAPVPLALALLVRDGRVLLAHRLPSRAHYPDCWDLVGGHVEHGESPEDAVVRECLEEIGVRIRAAASIEMDVEDDGLEVHAFVVTSWDGEPANIAPEEHDDLRWFRPDELADLRLAHPASLASLVRAACVAAGSPATADEPPRLSG